MFDLLFEDFDFSFEYHNLFLEADSNSIIYFLVRVQIIHWRYPFFKGISILTFFFTPVLDASPKEDIEGTHKFINGRIKYHIGEDWVCVY